MTQPERSEDVKAPSFELHDSHEVARVLADVAAGLPDGWMVTVEPSGQICLNPPAPPPVREA